MAFRVTNSDGRASNFLGWEDFKPGTYKMHFATGEYYKEKQTETFYPYAEVKLTLDKTNKQMAGCCRLCLRSRILRLTITSLFS